jgi:uncharacterized protein (UPF0261 family)
MKDEGAADLGGIEKKSNPDRRERGQMMKNILILAALDTKGNEVRFIKERIEEYGAKTTIVDAGILGEPLFPPDFSRHQVAEAAGSSMDKVRADTSEGEAMEVLIKGATAIAKQLYKERKIDGVLGIGGSMGTNLGTAVMRSLPIGVPKVMISTMAAVGMVVPFYVGTKDVNLFHSVADVAGLNRLTRRIFANAAGAVVGMANARQDKFENKKLIALSTLGTTEGAARMARDMFDKAGYETVTFHTTGAGGKSLEQVVLDSIIDGGICEFSFHEWVDRIAGGLFIPPDERYEGAGQMNLPAVYVPGSTDFIVEGPGCDKFHGRATHMHNRAITLYRTNRAELKQLGTEVGEKLNKSTAPTTVVIPMRGFSVQDVKGGDLYNPEANMGFVEGIESKASGNLKVKRVDAHVLEERFVQEVVSTFIENARFH